MDKNIIQQKELFLAYKAYINCVNEIEQLLLHIANGNFEECENKEVLLLKYELLHSKLDNDINFLEKLYSSNKIISPTLFQFYNCSALELHKKVHNYGNAIRVLISYYFPT